MYTLEFSRRAEKFLNKKLPPYQYSLVRKHLDELSQNPHPSGSIKMKGEDKVYRLRAGNYRITYEVHHTEIIILILDIDDRKDIYR